MVGERADEADDRAPARGAAARRSPSRAVRPLRRRHRARAISARSYITNRPIRNDILERFPKTLQLAGAAMLLATICGVTLGVLQRAQSRWARRPPRARRRLPRHQLPRVLGRPAADPALRRHAALAAAVRLRRPALPRAARLALGMRSIAFLARMTRSAMLDALGADYVRTARAKGLRERLVVGRHALRNALIPVITVLGLDFGAYLTGSILTETIFSLARPRPLRRERDRAARPAGHPGLGALSQRRVRAREPHHRPRVREGGPARDLRVSDEPKTPLVERRANERTLDAYQLAAARTVNPALDDAHRFLDAAAGLAEEAGEVLAHARKHVLQGKRARPRRRDRRAGRRALVPRDRRAVAGRHAERRRDAQRRKAARAAPGRFQRRVISSRAL